MSPVPELHGYGNFPEKYLCFIAVRYEEEKKYHGSDENYAGGQHGLFCKFRKRQKLDDNEKKSHIAKTVKKAFNEHRGEHSASGQAGFLSRDMRPYEFVEPQGQQTVHEKAQDKVGKKFKRGNFF